LKHDPPAVILRRMVENPYRLPTVRDIERLAFDGRISMEELCRRAEIHPSTFRYWKSGRSSPSLATVQALIDVGLAAVTAAERADAKVAPAKRRPRAKAKTKAAPASLRRLAKRSAGRG
jgi:transcriptional regulator with XRE-family HTH domain